MVEGLNARCAVEGLKGLRFQGSMRTSARFQVSRLKVERLNG